MALKYYFEFTDVESILHRCEISNTSFVGDAIEINGNCKLKKASTKDTLEAIRGGGLSIEILATDELNFEDLYSEEERTFFVEYFRDNKTMFKGWLDPEGLFQSFVDDKYYISLDCTDGLGFLKNLSYVDNNGLPFNGKQTQLEIIVNCLKRTNIQQNIYTNIEIWYDGLGLTLDVLDSVNLNSFRFVKDDGNTYMNCEEVLKTVLEPYGACITQYEGDWVIYKPNTLYSIKNPNFFGYDYEGNPLSPTKKIINTELELGSQIKNYYPHFVNENQKITIDGSIGAYRISYKYGLTNSFFDNIYLENVAGVVDEWTINDLTKIHFPADNLGFNIDTVAPGDPTVKIITSDTVALSEGNVIDFNVVFMQIDHLAAEFYSILFISVILTDGTDTYYLQNNGQWRNSFVQIELDTLSQITRTVRIKSNNIPINGNVRIEIFTPERVTPGAAFFDKRIFIKECFISPSDEIGDVKGETHTFERITKPSTKIAETKQVFNGDNISDLYVGTIYKSDKITPTQEWNRLSVRKVPLLRIMGEERMKMYAKPLRVFDGDVYGYVDFFSTINIDGLTGTYMPIEWDYDASENITSLKLKEILDNELGGVDFTDIEYSVYLDYGNVQEPTIKG